MRIHPRRENSVSTLFTCSRGADQLADFFLCEVVVEPYYTVFVYSELLRQET